MLTYTTRRNLAGNLTNDSSSTNLSVLDTLLNEADKEVVTTKPWGFRQKTKSISTVASQQFYQLPADCGRVINVTILNGNNLYSPIGRVKTREEWDKLNLSTAVTSNIPEWYFVFGKTLGFYPTPSTALTNGITFTYEREVKDLTIADYTTGTIVTATQAGTTVVGSGTAWTSQMGGRFIRITDSTTANTGDGYWYEISSVTNATTLVLTAPYNGASISAGSANYTIGQVSIVPEDFQLVPIHRAVENYYTFINPQPDRAKQAKTLFAEGMKRMQVELGAMGI